MPVTGQFGKVITGSGSMASAISGIASSYMTLRLNRIYNAFINKETFEGQEVTAAVAIKLLNKMMAMTAKGGKTQADVEETLRAVRKANRTRTLNEIDTKLKTEGATGDFANKVRVLEEMLLDPTLNPDETSDLRDELNDAVDDLLTNAQNQFAAGGKITLNGSTVDFAGGTNSDALLDMFDEQISRNPETSEKLNKQKVTAEASILVAKANAAWLAKARTTDSAKAAGYEEQLKFLREAYNLLNSSKYGLSVEASKVLTDVRSLEDNLATAKKNMGGSAAMDQLNKGYDNIFGDLDAIDAALKKDPTIAALFGPKESFSGFLQSDQNYALSILNQYTALNGNTITRDDGTKISLSIDDISDMMKDARVAANGLAKWAKTNTFLSQSDKDMIKSWDTFGTALGQAAPILTVEDKYDDAVDTLSKNMDIAGADIGARAAALRKFAASLKGIAGTAGLNSSVAKSLFAEADLYLTGKRPADGTTLYGDFSGNLTRANNTSGIYNIDEILGGLIAPGVAGERTSIFSAITAVYNQEAEWLRSGGKIITDINGNDVPDLGTQNTAAWEKGQSMRIKTLGTITLGEDGTTLQTLVEQDLQRVRIVFPGMQADPENPNTYTQGWIARVKQPDGTWSYIVTQKDKNSNNEKILTGAEAADFVRVHLRGSWDSAFTTIGGNRVIELPSSALRDASFTGLGTVDTNAIATGGIWNEIVASDSGYGWASGYQTQVDNAILKAVKDKKVIVRNGRIYLPNGSKIGGSQGEAVVDLDLTDLLSIEMRDTILKLAPTVDQGSGEGEGEGTGGEKPPTGNQRWDGTQWAGQSGDTVISKDAAGNDMTLDQAFSSGTGYMWATPPKTTGGGGGGLGIPAGGGRINPATKAKLDAQVARSRNNNIANASMKDITTGKITQAEYADAGGRRFMASAFRNMPTTTGATGSTPATGTKINLNQPRRNRNV